MSADDGNDIWTTFGVGLGGALRGPHSRQPVSPFGPDNPHVPAPTPGAGPGGPDGSNPFPDYFRPEPQHTGANPNLSDPMASIHATAGMTPRGSAGSFHGTLRPDEETPVSTRPPPAGAPPPAVASATPPPPPSPPSPPPMKLGAGTAPRPPAPFAPDSSGFDAGSFFDQMGRFGQ